MLNTQTLLGVKVSLRVASYSWPCFSTSTSFWTPFLLVGIYTPEQAGWILSSHHSCISLFPLQMFITAELNIAAKKCWWCSLYPVYQYFPLLFLEVKKRRKKKRNRTSQDRLTSHRTSQDRFKDQDTWSFIPIHIHLKNTNKRSWFSFWDTRKFHYWT